MRQVEKRGDIHQNQKELEIQFLQNQLKQKQVTKHALPQDKLQDKPLFPFVKLPKGKSPYQYQKKKLDYRDLDNHHVSMNQESNSSKENDSYQDQTLNPDRKEQLSPSVYPLSIA